MKKSIFTVAVTISTFACGLCSCSSIGTISRGNKYNNLYKERPVKIAILPVNNQTGDKDCISYFENTSDSVIIKKGYEICKSSSKESLLNNNTDRKILADAVFETIVTSWHTSKAEGLFEAEVKYLMTSLSTGDTLFYKEGNLIVDGYIKMGGGRLINIIATSVKSMTMDKGWIGKTCCIFLLADLPEGVHSPTYLQDMKKRAEKTVVQKKIKCMNLEQ